MFDFTEMDKLQAYLDKKGHMEDGSRSGITVFIDILKISKTEPPTPIPWADYICRKEI